MQRIALFVILLSLFGGVFQSPAAHAEGSPYDIKGVQVDALAESSVKARNKAFLEAQKKAFLVLATSYVSAEELPSIKPPSDEILAGLIQDFQIESEQVSTKRYLGVFDFRFKPAAVNAYFGHGPVNGGGDAATARSDKMLLLPYYQEGTSKAVFNRSENPYWTSLAMALPKNGNVILPEGSISDVTDIGDVDPLSLSATTLRRLMARYEVKDIAIALARVDLANPQTVKVEFFKAEAGHIAVANTIETTPQKVADETFVAAGNLVVAKAEPQNLQEEVSNDVPVSEIDARHFMGKGNRPIPTNVQARMQMIEKARENNEQMRAQASGIMGLQANAGAAQVETGGQSAIRVFFNSMTEWLEIQKEIRQAESLTNLRISSLKTNQVDIVVSYSDWSGFVNSLGRMGMALEPQADKTYILKRQSGQAF